MCALRRVNPCVYKCTYKHKQYNYNNNYHLSGFHPTKVWGGSMINEWVYLAYQVPWDVLIFRRIPPGNFWSNTYYASGLIWRQYYYAKLDHMPSTCSCIMVHKLWEIVVNIARTQSKPHAHRRRRFNRRDGVWDWLLTSTLAIFNHRRRISGWSGHGT